VPRLAAMTVYYICMILLSMAIRLFNRCCYGRTAEDLATPTMHVAHTLQNWVNGNLFQMCICETVIMIKSPHKATFRGKQPYKLRAVNPWKEDSSISVLRYSDTGLFVHYRFFELLLLTLTQCKSKQTCWQTNANHNDFWPLNVYQIIIQRLAEITLCFQMTMTVIIIVNL